MHVCMSTQDVYLAYLPLAHIMEMAAEVVNLAQGISARAPRRRTAAPALAARCRDDRKWGSRGTRRSGNAEGLTARPRI